MMSQDSKISTFLEMCDSAQRRGADRVVVASPGVLGDNCDEMMNSLNHLANLGLALVVISPEEPTAPTAAA